MPADSSTIVPDPRAEPLAADRRHVIAAAGYLNARPLIEGLDATPRVEVLRDVPSRLRRKLAAGEAEAALLPSIDLQMIPGGLTVIRAGCVASVGMTLTVRIFSQVPASEISVLWADTDSHTSVALARVLWAQMYDRRLRIIPHDPAQGPPPEDAEAVLLIGDKVVTDPPIGYSYQIDLGAKWFEMTGLPFVFAIWAAPRSADTRVMSLLLDEARRLGQQRLTEIALEHGPVYGWPTDMAVRYLTECLQFEFTDACREGMEEFFDRARDCGVLDCVHALEYC